MSSLKKLEQAKLILEKDLSIYLKTLSFEPKLARIHIRLRDGVVIFIQYNDYEENGYSIIFSKYKIILKKKRLFLIKKLRLILFIKD